MNKIYANNNLKKEKYIICYKDKIPFLSIPTIENEINIELIRKNYFLDNSIEIKLENMDKFIGW